MTAELIKVEIRQMDVYPEHDPYYPGQCKPSRTRLKIAYQNNGPFVYVTQDYNNNGTPVDEWHQRILVFDLEDEESGLYLPREEALREYLESETGQTLLNRIIQGHSIDWDGYNMVGQQNEDSLTAGCELLQAISNLPCHEWQLWNIEDWLYDYVHDEIAADTTDEQIKQMTAELEAEVRERCIILENDNVESYLSQYRNQLQNVAKQE